MNEPTTKKFWNKLNNSKLIHYLLLFAFAWAIAQVLAYFQSVIVIFVFAAILAFLLHYPVKWVEKFLPHGISVILVFLLSLLILGGLITTIGLAFVSQAQDFLEQAPQIVNFFVAQLEQLQNFLAGWNIQLNFKAIETEIRNQAMIWIGTGFTTMQGLLTILIESILIAVVALFMLLDGKRIWNFLIRIFPEHLRGSLTEKIQNNFLGFFWGRLILSIFFGVSVFIIFLLLQVPYALLLAAIAGVFDLIPGIGATLGISLVCLIILPQGVLLSLKVLIGCIILQQIEENLLMPRIMQGSINMNPVVMFFSLLVGARIAGLVGIFLSIPIAGVLISLLEIREFQGSRE
jgi:predicted PurR-regulated permease PerM